MALVLVMPPVIAFSVPSTRMLPERGMSGPFGRSMPMLTVAALLVLFRWVMVMATLGTVHAVILRSQFAGLSTEEGVCRYSIPTLSE